MGDDISYFFYLKDYSEVVDHPMDLHTVKEQLECGVYDNPPEYARDIRLIFHNSKAYNTNKRSRVRVWSLYSGLEIRGCRDSLSRDLARIFITGCPNWDFKNLGCPKSLIEKVKIITLIMYINKSSNYMLNSSRNVFVIILKLKHF